MKKNVLVFPCGSEIGLEIQKSLSLSTHFNVIGGSSVPDHGEYAYSNYIGGLPFVDDEAFTTRINEVITDYSIDYIFPAHDNALLKFAQLREAGELSCEIITSPLETCEIATSKLKTYKALKGVVQVPKIFDKNSVLETDLPIFLKPEVGNGSRGTHLAKTLEDVAFYTNKDPSLLLLEYLPGAEYTIDCFTDKNHKLIYCRGRKRARISNGISVNSVQIDDDRFAVLGSKINSALKFRGVWFFQVKENSDGKLVLMEIAPRVAGTMGLVRCKGVNLPLLSLFDAMGIDVSIIENEGNIVIDRALQNSYKRDLKYSHVYLDFDDMVIFEGRVNPQVMAFVFQCINKDIQVHLITRHKGDLQKTLKKYKLQDVFSSIILVKDEDEKYLYISELDSIFVDDSYTERCKVRESRRIPVFDAHMLESLMEIF